MFKLDSETALLDAFRPKDRALVELPSDLTFPRFVHHSLTWTHPAGGRVFLVFATPGGAPTGIAFQSNGGGGAAVAHLCDWCHHSAPGTRVALLTARINATRSAGVQVCADLGCRQRIEDEADRQGISAVPLLRALLERMGRFAHEGLGIDLSGAGR
jgi:hypothetical protein